MNHHVLSTLHSLSIGTPVLVQFDSTAFIPATFQGLVGDVALFNVPPLSLRIKASQINAIATI